MTVNQYTPVYCGRSDGETELRSKTHGREFNGPSNEQLDRVASPDDFYEPLDHDHPISIDWKRQLGAMLQKELNAKSNRAWFLMFFPENYRLYNHVKEGKDSTDAYLYGYPQGRKKRYRTALEFFPHLLWLMEGKSEDYGDCSCKNCSGEWIHKIEPLGPKDASDLARKEDAQSKVPPMSVQKAPLSSFKDPSGTKPRVVMPESKPAATSVNVSAGPPKAAAATNKAGTPSQPAPTPLPRIVSKEQQLDSQYRSFIYRIGELVWFNRGSAWGLAVIIRRDMTKNNSQQYLVQPLSNPLQHPEQKLMTSDDTLRPWLAWSAPGTTHRGISNLSFSAVDWKAVVAGQYGNGDAEVDGSILAAKQIDDSFTLIQPLSNNTITTGERTYLAFFLGGEKLYIGDPVRLRINAGHDVMVIHQIIEKLKPNSTNVNLASVYLMGDIYRYTTISREAAASGGIESNMNLPDRMKADLNFRNSITAPIKGTQSFWRMMQGSARVLISEIKGRWYESSIILPILRGGAVFAADVKRGEISDVGEWINGRGDANAAAGKFGTRYRDRLEALGKSIPPGVKLDTATGFDGAESTSVDHSSRPGAPTAGQLHNTQFSSTMAPQSHVENVAQQQNSAPAENDMAQFMNIDTMSE